jgi:hypothetical protein
MTTLTYAAHRVAVNPPPSDALTPSLLASTARLILSDDLGPRPGDCTKLKDVGLRRANRARSNAAVVRQALSYQRS